MSLGPVNYTCLERKIARIATRCTETCKALQTTHPRNQDNSATIVYTNLHRRSFHPIYSYLSTHQRHVERCRAHRGTGDEGHLHSKRCDHYEPNSDVTRLYGNSLVATPYLHMK
jgi:hypothetical protein